MRPRSMLLVLLIGAGCHPARDDEPQVRPPVPVATVVRDSLLQELQVSGLLQPSPGHLALLSAPASAVVKETRTQPGQRVAAGEVLLTLDSPELTASAQSSETDAQVAEQNATRQRALLDQGITARRTVEEKDALARNARANAASARAQLSRTIVRSPIRGEVQRVAVQVGERVDAGAPLVEIVDRSSLDLVAAVPPSALRQLRAGQSATIRAEAFAGSVIGQVQAVPPALDSVSRSGMAIIRVTNPGGWPVGLSATASITIGVLRHALIVPEAALVTLGDSQAVFVVGGDSVAHARVVTILARHAGRAAISGPIQADELVVTTGTWGLVDGMPVSPQPTPGDR